MEIIFARWRTLLPDGHVPTIGSLPFPHLNLPSLELHHSSVFLTAPQRDPQHSNSMYASFLVHVASSRWRNTVSGMDDGPIKATATGK